jgi:hypothetical protein
LPFTLPASVWPSRADGRRDTTSSPGAAAPSYQANGKSSAAPSHRRWPGLSGRSSAALPSPRPAAPGFAGGAASRSGAGRVASQYEADWCSAASEPSGLPSGLSRPPSARIERSRFRRDWSWSAIPAARLADTEGGVYTVRVSGGTPPGAGSFSGQRWGPRGPTHRLQPGTVFACTVPAEGCPRRPWPSMPAQRGAAPAPSPGTSRHRAGTAGGRSGACAFR